MSRRVLRDRLFNRLMKLTVYGQFVGGEDDTELRGTIEQLKADGIYPVLDYAVESDIGDKEEVSLETRSLRIRMSCCAMSPPSGMYVDKCSVVVTSWR